jgi:ketosteroid isomerase-like protein
MTESANVELVRSIHEAWERGDYDSVEWAHREIELVFADGPEPGSWTGVAAALKAWNEFLSAWDEWRTLAEDYREVDSERVLVLARFSGRGKTSGLAVEQMRAKNSALFHVRQGRVTRIVIYWDRERALADLGLAPEADASTR